MKPYRYKITIAYDGTDYSGWQYQPNALSIQEKMEETLQVFLKTKVHLHASGRTDAGVHAMGQVAHFDFLEKIDTHLFMKAANGLLPHEIRILNIEEVDASFHARFAAKGKIYHYHLHLDPVMLPFKRRYCHHVKARFEREAFEKAIKHFIGKHDFTSFANEPQRGSVSRNGVRTLKRLDIKEVEGGMTLIFEADGFLYKMVRNIVGTLLDVAKGKIDPDRIPQIIEKRDRRLAGRAAIPRGLSLMEVLYRAS